MKDTVKPQTGLRRWRWSQVGLRSWGRTIVGRLPLCQCLWLVALLLAAEQRVLQVLAGRHVSVAACRAMPKPAWTVHTFGVVNSW